MKEFGEIGMRNGYIAKSIYAEIDIMIINKTNKINKIKNENNLYSEKRESKGVRVK